jgi:hypothetical protein
MADRRRLRVYILVFFAGLGRFRILVSLKDSRCWISRLELEMGSLQPSRVDLHSMQLFVPFRNCLVEGSLGMAEAVKCMSASTRWKRRRRRGVW